MSKTANPKTAAAAAAKKAEAAKAKRAASKTVRGGEGVITRLTAANPHRAGTRDFFTWARLKADMTVAEAVNAGIDRSYIRYAEKDRALIKVS